MAGWIEYLVRRQQGWLEKAAAGLPAVQRGGAPSAGFFLPGDPPHTATGTTQDFVRILAQLGPETLKRMHQVSDTAMLPRFLTGDSCAHKPGAVTGVRNDVGFIEREGKKLTLAIFTQGCPDLRWSVENVGCLVVAKVVQRLAERFLGP